VPSDRRPLSKKDFRIALANLREKGGQLPLALRKHMKASGSRTVLASLASDKKIATKVPLPAHKPQAKPQKARIVLASLTPSFDRAQPERNSNRALTQTPPQQQPDKAGEGVSKNASIMPSRNSAHDLFDETPQYEPQSADATDPLAYEDDLDELLESQPFPIVPYLTETPVAHLDFTSSAPNVPLSMVHVLFGEKYYMLDTQFEGGLQISHMVWAQRFKGKAVDATLKRVTRSTPAESVRTARSR
jgi:hypothetical protein